MSASSTPPRLEVANPNAPRGRFRFALFDFDGTLSLIREGWQGVMIPYFVEQLLRCPEAGPHEREEQVVREFVERLTGKQTIYQCLQLAEEIRARGGEPRDPLEYKHAYLALLWERIHHRVESLKSGAASPETLLVPGSAAFLEALRDRGVALYLASGTDLPYVQDEVAALGLAHLFGSHVYGALDRYQEFSKQMIIDRILQENGLAGPELLVVGDGYVEIQNGKGVGGYALGVASDEAQPGRVDAWKRRRLLDAGADAIVPDFAELTPLMHHLFPRSG